MALCSQTNGSRNDPTPASFESREIPSSAFEGSHVDGHNCLTWRFVWKLYWTVIAVFNKVSLAAHTRRRIWLTCSAFFLSSNPFPMTSGASCSFKQCENPCLEITHIRENERCFICYHQTKFSFVSSITLRDWNSLDSIAQRSWSLSASFECREMRSRPIVVIAAVTVDASPWITSRAWKLDHRLTNNVNANIFFLVKSGGDATGYWLRDGWPITCRLSGGHHEAVTADFFAFVQSLICCLSPFLLIARELHHNMTSFINVFSASNS